MVEPRHLSKVPLREPGLPSGISNTPTDRLVIHSTHEYELIEYWGQLASRARPALLVWSFPRTNMVVLTRLSRGNQLNEDRKLLVRRAGSAWAEPESSAYENEAHLQEILAADPSQIPGVDAAPLTAIELPTAGGFVDVCVVGRNGSITVVECKLASNSERRRMVIGQVIDYAAAIWLDGADAFLASWERCAGKDLAVELDAEALEALRASITEGRIDLCLAVDKIDSDLRRLVEYLNQVTAPEVRVTSCHAPVERDRGCASCMGPLVRGR
ncbi:MAG: hypothetical protein IPN02_12160 [Candidatus Microthrix sp.]|uniref:DUF91 domain-containing protein n=1 Tax=Candidatus Neomicrothrix subdominans TaxID=2954438 RepID=A0A936NEJ9_9ACTN|nr:hypothetical protein [Candidatus Microthrix subdominans]